MKLPITPTAGRVHLSFERSGAIWTACIAWKTNSDGLALDHFELPFAGVPLRAECIHTETGLSGTYTVELLSAGGKDMLDGQLAAIAVETATKKQLSDTFSASGATFSRSLEISGPMTVKVQRSTSGVTSGIVYLNMEPALSGAMALRS